MGYWHNGITRLKNENKFTSLFKNVSNSLKMFSNMLCKMGLYVYTPKQQNKFIQLSNLKKKSINSIKEIDENSLNNHISKNMLITFTDLDNSKVNKMSKKSDYVHESSSNLFNQKKKISNISSNLFQITFSETNIQKSNENPKTVHIFKKSKVFIII